MRLGVTIAAAAAFFPGIELAAAADTLGLPAVRVTQERPEVIALGRKLFMERRLSANGTMSCAMCHVPEHAFTHNEIATAVGFNGQSLRRNAPTLLNVAFQKLLFHDGRETALERQVLSPLTAPDEMANRSLDEVIERLRALPDYAGAFERAFGQPASAQLLGQAIAAFERTLLSGNSRFDRWRYRGEETLSDEERQGFALFTGRAGCSRCHTVGDRDALFTDGSFHNTGLPPGPRARHRVPLAPGVEIEVAHEDLKSVSEPWQEDLGRFEVTGELRDRRAFKTPSLRNVALTAPYMHDGSLPTLDAVIEFYNHGGGNAPGQDPMLQPLDLSPDDRRALRTFLNALTGDNVARLAREARAAFPGAVGPAAGHVR